MIFPKIPPTKNTAVEWMLRNIIFSLSNSMKK